VASPCTNPALSLGCNSTVRSEPADDDPLLSRWVPICWKEDPTQSSTGIAVKVNESSLCDLGDASTTVGLGTRNTSSSPGLEGGEDADVGAVV